MAIRSVRRGAYICSLIVKPKRGAVKGETYHIIRSGRSAELRVFPDSDSSDVDFTTYRE